MKKLTIQMTIFFFIIFVIFGIIVTNEKIAPLNNKKIDEKFNKYILKNYKDLHSEFNIEKTEYIKTKYKAKISNKANNHLYFYLYYSNKKITSTYKKDYLEGKTLISYTEKKLKTILKQKTNKNYKVAINKKLNQYTSHIKENLQNQNKIETLKIYTIYDELLLNNYNTETISNELINLDESLNKKNITPKDYTIIITNKKNIAESIKIFNITPEVIKSKYLNTIIDDIINNNKSNILNKNNITYKKLN